MKIQLTWDAVVIGEAQIHMVQAGSSDIVLHIPKHLLDRPQPGWEKYWEYYKELGGLFFEGTQLKLRITDAPKDQTIALADEIINRERLEQELAVCRGKLALYDRRKVALYDR